MFIGQLFFKFKLFGSNKNQNLSRRKRKETTFFQTFILEPILTPSGLIDGGDDGLTLDVDEVEIGEIPLVPDDAGDEITVSDFGFLDGEFDEIPFIDEAPVEELTFKTGVFTVGDTGKVGVDFLFDGGGYRGEIAIFSLEGMENLELGSEEFIRTATERALSNSELGHIVIQDATEGARFSHQFEWEADFNSGEYKEVKTVTMNAGDRFAVMLVPNGTVQEVDGNPNIGGNKTPLFSLDYANPDSETYLTRIADVTGDGSTFALEDWRLDANSDRDYNDIVFQVRGAKGEAPSMDDMVDPTRDWRKEDFGQALIEYAKPYIEAEDAEVEGGDLTEVEVPAETESVSEQPEAEVTDVTSQESDLDLSETDEVVSKIQGEDWAQDLLKAVDEVKASDTATPVFHLDLNLTEIDAEGNEIPRQELTAQELAAITHARNNGVILTVPSGDRAGEMSALGELSYEFDNVITIGAAERVNDAVALANAYEGVDFSGEGIALDIVADGTSGETVSTTIAAAKVKDAIAQVWQANPELNYTQVIDIIKRTATDLETTNWDGKTGYGLLNVISAIHLAKATQPEPYSPKPGKPELSDDFISHNPAGKELPGIPKHPAVAPPGIPVTDIDRGGNSVAEATELLPSATQDIIDQVSNSDPTDTFRVARRFLDGAGFSVLAGELSVSYLTPSGQVLGTQVLTRGEHQLELPANAPDEVIVKIDKRGTTPTTYVLEGFESTETEPFDIELAFNSSFTPAQQKVMQAAAQSVSKLIGKGLPTAIVDGKLIDDIKIEISSENLDGVGGTQGRTKIDFMRYGSLLPALSLVQFDAADVAELEKSGQLFSAVQHEFLHALGFGNLWEAKGLVDYAGTPLAQYNGKKGVQAFKELGGVTDGIALETEGQGSAGLHWNEALFQEELMTSNLNFDAEEGGNAPISAVTLASLADLGYDVDLEAATPDFGLFGGEGIKPEDFTEAEIAAFRQQAEESLSEAGEGEEFIYAIMPEVDPAKVAPEIWAHAERFHGNGEYYRWEPYQLQSYNPRTKREDTLWDLAAYYLGDGNHYKWIGDRNGVANYNYIVAGEWIEVPIHHPNYEWEREQERLRREEELRRRQEEEARQRREEEERLAREKAEQERKAREEEERRQEAERKRRELEEQERRLREERERRRQEEERRKEEARLRELERQREIARQQGKGGQDWFFATRLPEFGPIDPFETKLGGETVGNLVPDDYYRFTLSRKGRLTAELKQLLADADLVLYDVRNKPIAYSMREGVTDEQIITDLIPGTYMLRVNSPKGVTTDYELVMKFQHKLSRTQQGPPPGWRVGGNRGGSGSSGGSAGAVFADPRINQIYTTALNNFSRLERNKANARIRELEAEKRRYEQDLQTLLDEMNEAQRNKVYGALDGVRHEANIWADNTANGINSSIDGTADWIINEVEGRIHHRLRDIDFVRNGINAFKGAVNGARSWLKGKVSWAQDRVKHYVWHFIDTIKKAYKTGAEINGIIEDAAREMKRGIDGVVNGINNLVGDFKGKILEHLEWLRNVRTPGWLRAVGVPDWNFYDGVAAPLANQAANGIKGAVSSVGNMVKGAVDWVKPRAQKAVAAIVDAIFGDKTGHLYNKIHKVDEQIAATQSELERKIVQKATELKDQMQGLLNTLGTEGKKLLDTILHFAGSTGGQVTIELIKVALGFVPVVGQAIDVVDTALALWKVVVDGRRDTEVWVELIGSLAGWFPGVGDAIKGIAKVALKSPIGALLRKLGPDVTKQAAKIFKDAKWKSILADVVEGLAGVWRKFDSQMDNAAGWILDLMPGVRPTMAAVGEIVVKFNDEAAEAGKYLDDVSQQIAKKIDSASEQIAKEDAKTESDNEDGNLPVNDDPYQKKPDDSDSTSTSIKKMIQRHINDLDELYKRSNESISDDVQGKNNFLKNIQKRKDQAKGYQDDSENVTIDKIETLKNDIAGFNAELNDALRPNVKLTDLGRQRSNQEIDNIAIDLRDGFTVFTEVKNNESIKPSYLEKQGKRVIEAASRNDLFTKARFVFLKGLKPEIEKGLRDLGDSYGVIVEIEK